MHNDIVNCDCTCAHVCKFACWISNERLRFVIARRRDFAFRNQCKLVCIFIFYLALCGGCTLWDIVNDLIRTQISANVIHTHKRNNVTMCNRWWLFNRLKCISIRCYGAISGPFVCMNLIWFQCYRHGIIWFIHKKNQLNTKISLICDVRIKLWVLDWNALSTLVYSLLPNRSTVETSLKHDRKIHDMCEIRFGTSMNLNNKRKWRQAHSMFSRKRTQSATKFMHMCQT